MKTEEARLALRRKFSILLPEQRQKCWKRVQKHLRCEVCKRQSCAGGGYVTDYENEVHFVACKFCALSCVAVLAEGV